MARGEKEETLNPRGFFMIFFAGLCSQKLRIPPGYHHQISTNSLGTVSLEGPSGHNWKVELVQNSEHFYFEKGWESFVFDHSLKTNDMLIFREEGKNHFSVQAIDSWACEKESCFEVKKPNNQGGVNDTGVKSPNVSLAIVTKEPDVKPKKIVISQRRPVTQEEIDDALERARAFQSKHPFVIIVMQNSYVYSTFFLRLHVEFARKHLPKTNTELTVLGPCGRSWAVQYLFNNGRGAISRGWSRASFENNLELYDAVVFELVKKNQLKMHVFRVVKEITPLKRLSKFRY